MLAVAAVIGTTVFVPTGAASAAPACEDNKRKTAEKAAKEPDMREVQTKTSDGSRFDAEITLRFTPSMRCAWALFEGVGGAVWLERAPAGSGGIDRMGEIHIEPEERVAGRGWRKKTTHTVAADLMRGPVRACGEGIDGEEGRDSRIGVGPDGPNAELGESETESQSLTQCTDWIHWGGHLLDKPVR
jgi:hypothetical protein